jgi:all-trans-retinol dehydrogenase (NAD+)
MAIRFAKLGSHLVLWDMNSDSNEETAALCREFSVQVNTYTCDLSKRDNVYTIANKVRFCVMRASNFAVHS